MRHKILSFLRKQQGKKYSIRGLSKALDLTSAEMYKELAKTVNTLEEEALIMPNRKNEYTLIEYTSYASGVLDVKDKGFAFLMLEQGDEEDVYIPGKNLNNAMHGDRVLVHVVKSPKGFKKEGRVVRILTRNYTHIVGTVIARDDWHYLIADDKSIKTDIRIPKTHLNGAKPHDKVKAEIINYAFEDQDMVCKVTSVIGNMNDKGVDVYSKILKHDIEPEFPKKVLKEASRFQTLDEEEARRRHDLRDRTLFTIDGADAKDFDDAVEAEELENGDFFLGVHIADVSYYVSENSPLDKEAFKRGTSVYLVDRVIPMLPENLSNNLCSLMPNVERFAITCEMVIDKHGNVKKHDIFESLIESKARLTYDEVNEMMKGEVKEVHKGLLPTIETMKRLAGILRKKRHEQGSLNFETDEPEISLDENGKAVDVKVKERGESEKFIEEFMLIANQTVAKHVYWMDLPFIYRVHEAPKEEKLEKLLTMANALGFNVKARKTITHKEMQKLLQKVENTASEKGMNMMMLRSMQKAVYQKESVGHFGLAFEHYTHFTSPIRRYPDLIVHRLLRNYFFKGNQTDKTLRHYDDVMDTIAEASSEKERRAIGLERDVLDMKKAEYMQNHIDETFTGHISGVTGFGLYVSLDNTIEGLIHISELDDDYYVFDEDHLTLIGRHKKRVFRMGDEIKIKVRGVNVFDGEIDFAFLGGV